jgi:hypothetical protein
VLRLLATVVIVLSSMAVARSAAAAECRTCIDSVALQTRDGQPWQAGQPVTLVVRITNHAPGPLPDAAQAVVMQTDGDRTKCLGVPLKLVDGDASSGLYAGLFFPFRAARYDGVLSIGEDVQDITFDVNRLVAGAAPAGDLPAAEPLDTSAPVPPITAWPLPLLGGIGVPVALGLALLVASRRRLIAAV